MPPTNLSPRSVAVQGALPGSVKVCAVVGFPLGFHDVVHHLPVLRHAAIASPFGIRFQAQGFFLTDARTHRGTSGAPVLMRVGTPTAGDRQTLPWKLLGVHSARLDMGGRDLLADDGVRAWEASAAAQLDQSLQRLQTDRIDLVQVHEVIRTDDPDRVFAPGGATISTRRS